MRVWTGIGAALVLASPLLADDSPAAGKDTKDRAVQGGRSRGFGGFSEWDSRSGRYDRSRFSEEQEKKDDTNRPGGRDAQGPRGGPLGGGGGPGFGPGGRAGGGGPPGFAPGARRGFG